MSIAQVILSQIKAIDGWAMSAWGAKDLVNIGNGLQFKTSGMTPWKGQVAVTYDEGADLYNIKFYRIRKANVIVDKEIKGVYAEDLVSMIDDFVG